MNKIEELFDKYLIVETLNNRIVNQWIEGKDIEKLKKDLQSLINSAVEEAIQDFANDNKTADDYFLDGVAKGKEQQKEKDAKIAENSIYLEQPKQIAKKIREQE